MMGFPSNFLMPLIRNFAAQGQNLNLPISPEQAPIERSSLAAGIPAARGALLGGGIQDPMAQVTQSLAQGQDIGNAINNVDIATPQPFAGGQSNMFDFTQRRSMF